MTRLLHRLRYNFAPPIAPRFCTRALDGPPRPAEPEARVLPIIESLGAAPRDAARAEDVATPIVAPRVGPTLRVRRALALLNDTRLDPTLRDAIPTPAPTGGDFWVSLPRAIVFVSRRAPVRPAGRLRSATASDERPRSGDSAALARIASGAHTHIAHSSGAIFINHHSA